MIKILLENNNKFTLRVFGNIANVASGRVDETLETVDLTHFSFALGSASFSDVSKYGEALVIDSNPFITWNEGDIELTDSKKPINSAFIAGIETEEIPARLVHYTSHSPIQLENIYQELEQKPIAYAFVGLAFFSEFFGTYLDRLPIEKNIPSWKQLPPNPEVLTCCFGIVIPEKLRNKFPQEMLNRAFGKGNHTHGAILKTTLEKLPSDIHSFYEILKTLSVEKVRHLLPESTLKEGLFAIFPFEKIVGLNH